MDPDLLPSVFGSVLNLVALAVFVAGVMKIFQIANTLIEIKDTVKDIQRNQDLGAPAARVAVPSSAASPRPIGGLSGVQSGDEMLRALDAELNLHPSDELEPVRGEIINPR